MAGSPAAVLKIPRTCKQTGFPVSHPNSSVELCRLIIKKKSLIDLHTPRGPAETSLSKRAIGSRCEAEFVELCVMCHVICECTRISY
jgi:hypothetical protein